MKEITPGVQVEVNEVDGDTVSLILDIDASTFIEEGWYNKDNSPESEQRFFSVEELLDEMPSDTIIEEAVSYLTRRYKRNKEIEYRYSRLINKAKERISNIEAGKFKELFPLEAQRMVARYWVLIGRLQKRKLQLIKKS